MKFVRLCLFLLPVLFHSCISQKKLVYFQGEIPPVHEKPYQLKISPGDILSINVFSINTEAFPYFATPADRGVSDNRTAYEKGYVVSESGEVKIPLIGNVKVDGMTLKDATSVVETKLKEYIADPLVTIKKLNFQVTVLGEVNKPGTFVIANEKVTLPEALGLAGDLSPFADRQVVKIIREENRKTNTFTVDLTDASSLSSETYYLHPDDIIYIQPLPRRAFQNINPSVTLFTSILTTTVVVMTFILTQTN